MAAVALIKVRQASTKIQGRGRFGGTQNLLRQIWEEKLTKFYPLSQLFLTKFCSFSPRLLAKFPNLCIFEPKQVLANRRGKSTFFLGSVSENVFLLCVQARLAVSVSNKREIKYLNLRGEDFHSVHFLHFSKRCSIRSTCLHLKPEHSPHAPKSFAQGPLFL